MSRPDNAAGFYGKLPSHGDFLSRRLPRQFIEPWDQWLQAGIAASREQLGKDWLNTFLVSPIWHFGLAPGLCGGEAWAGVMMPSVDKVGRYFPLTLAAKVDASRLPELFDPVCGWFEALTQLAFSSLDYDFDLQRFDEGLQRLCLTDFLSTHPAQSDGGRLLAGSARLAFQFQLESDWDTPQAFEDLGGLLKERFLAHCSYWRSSSGNERQASLLLCEGLPPIDAYVGFLNDDWPRRGWRFSSSKVTAKPPVETGSVVAPQAEAVIRQEEGLVHTMSYLVEDDEQTLPLRSSLPAAEEIPDDSPWQSFGLSVVGLRRKLNEDSILLRSDVGLWAVADGMGGHSAGDVASQALVAALAQIPPVDDLEYFSEQVASSLHAVNRNLVQMGQSRGNGHIIGSTIVVLLIAGRQFRYLWAGDSRLYRYRQGELEQLTLDHSLYNESISQGLSPLDGSLEQGRGNIITRAVGADTQLQLDCGQGDVLAGDMFILSSDGLDKELSHADIAALCASGTVGEITRRLIREAEKRGGRDNISVIVVKTSAVVEPASVA
ncbi:type VI secretion system-associated protein TagF [Methylomonas sp. LL1]|uniref:type VI secretion system-associated protein TagF n=1 Tax=Methylomonas sp. LL1 TaxID=2785785 RepID=UPI0018C418DC|nr:type VI secretion system-associated protein TagF [Methylomonas sp. LL1]QPK63473.1 type VI secretion system-associated protein TagF [Methylomonas sp. LL1]